MSGQTQAMLSGRGRDEALWPGQNGRNVRSVTVCPVTPFTI